MDKEKKIIKVALKPYKELNTKFTQVSNFMRQYITDAYTFKVYFYLCERWNSVNNYAFPSIRNISKECSMSTQKVQNCIKWLIEEKLIVKKSKEGYDGRTYNIYYINYIDIDDVMEEVIASDETKYIEIEVETDENIEEKNESESES